MCNSTTESLNESSFDPQFTAKLSELIRNRRTTKVLARSGQQVLHPQAELDWLNRVVLSAVADAGYAPFHYDRKENGLAEPWRFHLLWQRECRILSGRIAEWFPEINASNKLPAMLSACGALVLANWLPQFDAGEVQEKQQQVNEEHLAATASAVQNLLLTLTANSLKTYWSSGGFFRSPLMFEKLGIPATEKLLAAVFVDYGANAQQAETIPGNNRALRSHFRMWTTEISLLDDC